MAIFLFILMITTATIYFSNVLYFPEEGITPILKGKIIDDFFDSSDGSKLPFRMAGWPFFHRAGEVLDRQIEETFEILDLEVGKNWQPNDDHPRILSQEFKGVSDLQYAERSRMNLKIRVSANLDSRDRSTFLRFLKSYFIKKDTNDGAGAAVKTTTEALREDLQANVAAYSKRVLGLIPTVDAENMTHLNPDGLNTILSSLGFCVKVTQLTILDMNPTAEDLKRRNSKDAVTIAQNEAEADRIRATALEAKKKAEKAGEIDVIKATAEAKGKYFQDRKTFVEAVAKQNPEALEAAMLSEAERVTYVKGNPGNVSVGDND